MSKTTVAELATELHKTTDSLLEQLASAGVAKAGATDVVSESDKKNPAGTLASKPWCQHGSQEDHPHEKDHL